MTIEEISRLAINSDGIDQTEPCEVRCLYYTLQDIYRQFRSGRITQAVGSDLKNKAIRQFQIDQGKRQLQDQIIDKHGKLYRAIESAANQCRKNPCKDTAVRLLDALYGTNTSEGALGISHGIQSNTDN